MRPTIGITVHCDFSERENRGYRLAAGYAEAVAAAGGIPLLLPVLQDTVAPDEVLARLDGLLVSGGEKLPADAFTANLRPSLADTNPVRYRYDRALLGAARQAGLPILGICRGHQMLNEVAGGSLIRNIALDVPGALEHRQSAPGWQPVHSLRVAKGSRLDELGIPAGPVNSFHRQAVKEPGTGFIAVAWSPDGLVEAIEMPGARFVLGLQFHPEKLWPREPAWLAPFRALVSGAAH
ncbi:MAG TPA: gamma-glutamyl-gamma-aminobutyrate hydrolase family protein [Candidatus Methylomirabilis sp.]|nr:gamma-glutamyl-gamma-aminobutyrate hydrolase family protein [Candidatus Methylomirabilis sp.]